MPKNWKERSRECKKEKEIKRCQDRQNGIDKSKIERERERERMDSEIKKYPRVKTTGHKTIIKF